MRRLALVCLGFFACYSPPEPDCGFVCGPGGACPDDYTCASDNICHRNGTDPALMCKMPVGVSFDVQSVMALDPHTVQITYNSTPDAASAQNIANYAISGLTITNASLSGATVTLTTSAQAKMTYTVAISGVTRATDGAMLTTNMGSFAGIASFNVMGAASTSNTQITVTFDAPPDPSLAMSPGNYAVTGLTLSNPVLSGMTVTLDTSPQAAQMYSVVVTGVKRASDFEGLDTNSASFTGRIGFNVQSAASISHTRITVTFDAAPNVAQATTLANYSVSGLTLSGTPTLSGNTVTLTTSGQANQTYTVTVGNVTRASDGQALVINSAMFTGRSAFDVTAEAAASHTSVVITFSDPPDPTAAGMIANYAEAGSLLTLSNPVLSGNTVTLTTSAQSATQYTIVVSNVTRASDSEPLTVNGVPFTGRTAFDVTGAATGGVTTVTVTFSAPPDMTQATMVGNYSANNGLTFTGTPSLSGSTVTLTSSTQSAVMYTVTVSGVTRASDGEALAITSAMFTGTNHCIDGMQDGDETDLDCGGPTCTPCANGLMCMVNSDCLSNNCSGGTTCAP